MTSLPGNVVPPSGNLGAFSSLLDPNIDTDSLNLDDFLNYPPSNSSWDSSNALGGPTSGFTMAGSGSMTPSPSTPVTQVSWSSLPTMGPSTTSTPGIRQPQQQPQQQQVLMMQQQQQQQLPPQQQQQQQQQQQRMLGLNRGPSPAYPGQRSPVFSQPQRSPGYATSPGMMGSNRRSPGAPHVMGMQGGMMSPQQQGKSASAGSDHWGYIYSTYHKKNPATTKSAAGKRHLWGRGGLWGPFVKIFPRLIFIERLATPIIYFFLSPSNSSPGIESGSLVAAHHESAAPVETAWIVSCLASMVTHSPPPLPDLLQLYYFISRFI